MSLKIKADNGVEMHAGSSNKFKPKLILDDCSVSKCLFFATEATKLRSSKTKSFDWPGWVTRLQQPKFK